MTRNQAKLLDLRHAPSGSWQLDGTMKDESGMGFDLAVDAGTERYGMGAVPGRKAGFFDGDSILARASHDADLLLLEDITMQALVFPTSASSADQNIFTFEETDVSSLEANNQAYGWQLTNASMNPSYNHHNSTRVTNTNTWSDVSIPLYRWTHLAMVRDDTAKTVTLYVNGVAHADVYTYTNSPTGATSSRFGIGGAPWAGSAEWDGLLTSCQIIPSALTPTQVLEDAQRCLSELGRNVKTPDNFPERSPGLHSNIKVWHRADSNDTEDGDSVQTPTLLGGANGLAMDNEAIRPLMHTDAGQASWKMYDGASAFYFSGAALSSYIDDTPAFQAFCAFILHDVTLDEANLEDNHRIFGDDNGAWGVYARRSGSIVTEVYGFLNDGAVKTTIHSGVTLGEAHLIEFWYDGNGSMISRLDDGPQVETAVSAISEVTAPLELGGQDVLSGSIMELLVASLTGSALEVTGTRNYFKNRYGMDV